MVGIMSPRIRLALVLALASSPASHASAALTNYVSGYYNINVQARDDQTFLNSDGATDNSGQLQQASFSADDHTIVFGDLTSAQVTHAQQAEGSITQTAEIGALHTLVKASADTGNYPYGALSNATAIARSESITTWFDTVTFFTNNPNGSLFHVDLILDDFIINTSEPQTADATFATGSDVFAKLNILGLPGGTATLSIDDNEFIRSDGSFPNLPDSFDRNYSFLIQSGTKLSFLETLDVVASAGGGDTATVANAANTARFLLYTSDPDASYISASGVVFAVPEPATLALLVAGTLAVTLRRRR